MSAERSKFSPKRSAQEKMADRAKIAELYVTRHTALQITAAVNEGKPPERQISLSMVNKEIEGLRKGWRERNKESIDQHFTENLELIDTVISEAYSEWLRSKQDYKLQQLRSSTSGSGNEAVDKFQAAESKTGDPRYLSIILQAIERKSKLLGLDAPVRLAGPDGEGLPLAVNIVVTDRRPTEVMGNTMDAEAEIGRIDGGEE